MSFTTGTPDGGLWGRLDEIETRLEYLEAVVLDDTERAATPSTDGLEVPPAVVDEPEIAVTSDVASAPVSEAEAPTATKDRRTLQREATADVPMVQPAITSAPAQPLIDLRFVSTWRRYSAFYLIS